MRFCILAHGYSGATLPLARHLSDQGHEVTCYYLCWNGASKMESIDYGTCITELTTITLTNTLYAYLPKSVRVYIAPIYNEKHEGRTCLRLGKRLINRWRTYQLAERIRREGYDMVNVLVYTDYDACILRQLVRSGVPCCQTYHEVLSTLTGNRRLLPPVERCVRLRTPIVLHSEKTRQDLLSLCDDATLKDRIRLIHFGPFESFLQYGEGRTIEGVPTGALLYLGFIKPYKGLRYLYEAVQWIDTKATFKIVVAGGGHDEVLEQMRKDSRFVLVNRFIENDELVWLLRQCKALVCPYVAASQSGLVQTAMVFHRPIIATRVGAFTELIEEGRNGYLAEPADARSLQEAIMRMMSREQRMEERGRKELNWDNIAEAYVRLTYAAGTTDTKA